MITSEEYEMLGCRKCGVVQYHIKDNHGDYIWKPLDEKQMEVIKEQNMW